MSYLPKLFNFPYCLVLFHTEKLIGFLVSILIFSPHIREPRRADFRALSLCVFSAALPPPFSRFWL